MINELEQLQNFQEDVGSRDPLDRLGALQSMQGQDPGLMGLPVVQEPVGDPRAMLQPEGDPRAMLQNIPPEVQQPNQTIRVPISAGGTLELDPNTIAAMEAPPINPMLGAPQGPVNPMLDVGPIIQRKGGGMAENVQIIGDTAEGLASFGRHGDSMLVHMNPEEVAGLSSLGEITYNPITGLPEAWGIKSFFKPFKQAAKSIKKVTKSKAFRQLAPIALAIAAPYAAAYMGWGVPAGMAANAPLAAKVAAMGPMAYGLSTAVGSGLGALAGGAKTSDAWKAAALGGLSAGALRGYTNYQNTGSMWQSPQVVSGPPTVSNLPADPAHVTTSFTPGSTGAEKLYSGAQASNLAYQVPMQPVTPQVGELYAAAGNPNVVTAPTPIKPNWIQRQTAALGDTQLGRGVGQGVDYITDPQSITGGIIEDYGTGTGLAKLAAIDAMTPDYTGDREKERSLNEAREELERQEWEFKRVLSPEETGFGQTYVVVDPSGVEYNLTEAEILDIAYGRRARPKLTPTYRFNPDRFVPTKHGGGLGSLIHRQEGDQIGTPDVVGDTRDSLGNELINDLSNMTPEEFETKYNMTMQEGHNQLKVMFPEVKSGDWNELFSGRALQPLPKQPLPSLPVEKPVIPRAHGGEFSGQVPGQGHGMQDNVYMPIKDKGKQVGTLAVSPSEYVVDSYTMSALGNGNPDAGAKVMDGVVESVRKKAYGTIKQPNEINGLQALRPMMERV
jgi:hypothetical protein